MLPIRLPQAALPGSEDSPIVEEFPDKNSFSQSSGEEDVYKLPQTQQSIQIAIALDDQFNDDEYYVEHVHPQHLYPHSPRLLSSALQPSTPAVQGHPDDHHDEDEDLQRIYTNIHHCVELRRKYMTYSAQRPGDNPKDWDDWLIYPAPPRPSWPNTQNLQEEVDPLDEEFQFSRMDVPGKHHYEFSINEIGIYTVYKSEDKQPLFYVPEPREYFKDLEKVLEIVADGESKTFAFSRMKYMEAKWNMYKLLNEHKEQADCKRVPHRDFYNVRKVDTHIHHTSSMNQKHLLRFIKKKIKSTPDDVVLFRDGKELTLRQVFESLNLTAYDLSINTLDMHAHTDSFHRFDKFNSKYNPIGESRLREIFLKIDNYIQGRYLAEITKEIYSDLEQSKYQMAEYRLSVYGHSRDEWDKLARWVVNNKLFSHNVRWLVQIPRLYTVYKATGKIQSFQDIIQNVFEPLYEVTKDPKSHPELHIFLQRVVGLDSVDDESRPEKRIHKKYPSPLDWTSSYNPPYAYWMYYTYANLCSLNQWRKERKFNTLVFRPHSGEAGDSDHLSACFLTAYGINHGIVLRKVPVMQYLFYLEQVGMAMSPLSNNALFLHYDRNPFPQFFARGLNVSLSTDDPLQFHFTREPLIEEYSIAAQIWKFSSTDMCEVSRNSVLQSGFEMRVKKMWLGENCHLEGSAGNDMQKTNLPKRRIKYRQDTLREERKIMLRHSRLHDKPQ